MTKLWFLKLFLFVIALKVCYSAKILASTFVPREGQHIPFRKLWIELANRGHEITLITTDPMGDPSLKNMKEIDLSGSYSLLEEINTTGNTVKDKWNYLKSVDAIVDWQFAQPDVKDLIQNGKDRFDILIVEIMNPMYIAFADRFKIPFIGIATKDCPNRVHAEMGNYVHPILYPDPSLSVSYPMTFKERLTSTVFTWFSCFLQYHKQYPKENKIIRKHFGKDVRDLQEIEKDMSLLILNVNPVIETIRPTRINTVFSGSNLNFEKPKPLPDDLRHFLDNSKEGVVYINLGANLKTAVQKQEILLEAFDMLPYKFLWKSERLTKNLPKNVMIMNWLPQQDVLGHPNVKLFISLCDLQSLEEAIFKNVPILAIPLLSDHYHNAHIVESKAIGLSLNHEVITKEGLYSTINDVINNPIYKTNIIELAQLAKYVETDSLNRTIWSLEHIIRTKGAKHFRSPRIDLPFYQFYMLDVYGFIIFVLLSPFLLLLVLMKCFVWYFRRKRTYDKKRKFE